MPAATPRGSSIPRSRRPPFRPLHIEKGSLKPSDLSYEEAVPASCADAPAPRSDGHGPGAGQDGLRGDTYGLRSGIRRAADPAADRTEYKIPFRYASDTDDQPERQARLFRFFCGAGAYNESHVYYLYDEIDGLRELQFATPELDIRYENDDSEGKVESVTIIGYRTDETSW